MSKFKPRYLAQLPTISGRMPVINSHPFWILCVHDDNIFRVSEDASDVEAREYCDAMLI